MVILYKKIGTSDGRFLTLLTGGGPVTAEADNPGALNQIWGIPDLNGEDSTIQNLGYPRPQPFAVLDPAGSTVVGGHPSIDWKINSEDGSNFNIHKVGSDLTWTIAPGVGSIVTLSAENLTDPAQQLVLVPAAT
ncbi:hypothetical protein PAXRUDRAFT_835165 [Paxillus rubicundulus Ve08.2h10]|uniref:Ricin B lectin domain-containing protein n=1 Tax=Paxillus rubicundulus Ve08.2h10 TaxID=930991 RepID=A0A0D0D967_9AGAM|nr:hypothetical protein PAXRUDRAFT_835165 [Paxillus rubicundulus Ve08.2h10]